MKQDTVTVPPRGQLSEADLDLIFREARTHNGWTQRPLSPELIRRLYSLVKWGPTAANTTPGRFVSSKAPTLAELFRQSGEQALQILVNNAGRTWGAPFESFSDKAWAGVMAVNVQGPFRMIQELLPELEAAAHASDPSRVINIGSVAGTAVNDVRAYSYSASKAAIHFLGGQLASEFASRNITVNTVAPGYFPTDMTAHLQDVATWLANKIPLRRMGSAADIAGAIIFLSSRAGAYLTGSVLPVDGGIAGTR